MNRYATHKVIQSLAAAWLSALLIAAILTLALHRSLPFFLYDWAMGAAIGTVFVCFYFWAILTRR